MATYFVRISGNDSNAGTSAGAAWRTLGKALGAAGIASGDTVYVGAGVYRESVTVNMTSATVETKIVGDVDGAQTGDAGDVIWSAFTTGDFDDVGTGTPLVLNGRDFLTFEKIAFVGANNSTAGCVNATTTISTDIAFTECTFFPTRPNQVNNVVAINGTFATALNWTFDRCRFLNAANLTVTISLPTGVGADYDANVQVKNCLFVGPGTCVSVTSSGTSANEGGGVDVHNCTALYATTLLATSTLRVSLTIPCTAQNCAGTVTGPVLNSSESGNLLDNGGNRFQVHGATSLTNVTAHGTTRLASFPCLYPLSFGQEHLLGQWPRPFGAPYAASGAYSGILGFGNQSGQTTDLFGRARPEGCGVRGDAGTATSGATTSITDSGKSWGTDQWVGWLVRTTGGTGSGQVKRISSNTGTALTISGAAPAGGLWATTPDSTTTYLIYQGPQVETGKATAGAASTLTDGGANWATNQWAGYTVEITGGTGSGQTATISSNTGTVLTRSGTWTTNPNSTSTYSLYYPGGSLTATQAAAGAMEGHETAQKEVTTTDAGSVGIRIEGPGSHRFAIPVDAASTTISVKARYDSDHGTGSKPQAILEANGEIGVTAETKTMTSAADTWETLSFAAQTPSAKGVVFVTLVSRSATPYGRCYWDTWSIV